MDKVKLSFDFLITMIFTLLLAACGGNGGDFSSDASLVSLTLSSGELDQIFQSSQLEYTATVGFLAASTTVTPTVEDTNAMVAVNDTAVISGNPGESIFLGQGDTVITVMVTAEDGVTTRTYTITVTRQSASSFAQQAYIKASNTGIDDHFGFSVALSGDTLAVGARWEDSAATGIDGDQADNSANVSGAVYVFTREGTVWRQQAYIKASNTGAGDIFGYSVTLSGDTLAVGAPWEDSAATGIDGDQADNSADDSGAVYVFTREGTVWRQQAYIKASNTGTSDHFGYGVALSGDTLAVGARWEDSAATGIDGDQADNSANVSGAVYVFTREGTAWRQQAYIKASNTDTNDNFGDSVAISGAVYVFTREGTVWRQQAYIKASNTGIEDLFGDSVALSGDTLAVGAPSEDSAATGIDGDQADNSAWDSGAVYVFTREGTAWRQQAYIKASNTGAADVFGDSVALSGDTLAVGAFLEDSATTGIDGDQADNSANFSGAVYVFTREGRVWHQQAYIKASNTDTNDNFGDSVALSGDTLAVGALLEDSAATGIDGDQADNSAEDSGAVYVYQ